MSILIILQRAFDSTTISQKTLIRMIYYRLWCDDYSSIVTVKKFCLHGKSFDIVHVTANDVKSCIINMDSKKSTGYDWFPVKLLKFGTDLLSMIIPELINISIDECTFPVLLKYAEIAALFKKLDRLCNENYRHVSILTALSKDFLGDVVSSTNILFWPHIF